MKLVVIFFLLFTIFNCVIPALTLEYNIFNSGVFPIWRIGVSQMITLEIKGELHSNFIFLHFALIGLEQDSITLFTKMNFFFFQNSHFNTL